jgi:hypothetical protein
VFDGPRVYTFSYKKTSYCGAALATYEHNFAEAAIYILVTGTNINSPKFPKPGIASRVYFTSIAFKPYLTIWAKYLKRYTYLLI